MLGNIAQWSKLLGGSLTIVLLGLLMSAFTSIDTFTSSRIEYYKPYQDTIPYLISPADAPLDITQPVSHCAFFVASADYPAAEVQTTSNDYKLQFPSDTLYRNQHKSNQALTFVKTVSVCQGEGYFAAKKPRFVSGIFRDTLNTMTGRDSIVITHLSVITCKYSE